MKTTGRAYMRFVSNYSLFCIYIIICIHVEASPTMFLVLGKSSPLEIGFICTWSLLPFFGYLPLLGGEELPCSPDVSRPHDQAALGGIGTKTLCKPISVSFSRVW